jgi:hypothetical protein
MWIALWEQAYVAWALDRAIDLRSTPDAAGASMRNRIADVAVALFTSPDWPRDHNEQMPYLLNVGEWSGLVHGDPSTIVYRRSWAAVAAATFATRDPASHIPYMDRPFEGYYGPEARLLLMMAAARSLPGAAAALSTLTTDANNGTTFLDDLNARAGWALASVSARP